MPGRAEAPGFRSRFIGFSAFRPLECRNPRTLPGFLGPPKIPCVGFSLDTASSDHSARCLPVRVPLPVTAEPPFCAGLRVRRLRSRTAGQMRPHIPRRRHGLHRPTGAASSYSVSGVLCPRRCPLLHQGSPTGPSLHRGYVVRSVIGTTARSARLVPANRFRFWLIRSALPFTDVPGGARALPSFASCAFLSCRCPYGGGTLRLHWPVSLSEVTAFAHAGRARLPLAPRHSLLPGVLITSRQPSLNAAARELARLPW